MVGQSGGLLVVAWLLLETTTAGFSCLSNPCVYGICMDDLNSSFTCYCVDGYTGVHCQTNWDECWSSPCLNGGLCHDGVATYNCSCPEGFVGDMCEENVDECSSNPCHNNATCMDVANGYTCQCVPGYSGTFCEIDIAVCNSTEDVRCHNGGVCQEGPGISFSCFCTPGWTGKLCEVPIDECASNPCQNGAVCIDLHNSYSCACLFGFTGHDCDLVLSMCTSNPCHNDALCLVEEDTSVCYCVPDYHGDRCQFQYDECLLGPGCKNGGTCIDGVDSFSCSCPPDLTGQFCECLILNESGALDCFYTRPTTLTTTTTALPTTTVSSTSTSVHTSTFVPTTQTFLTTTEFFTTLLLETSAQTTQSTSTTVETTEETSTSTPTELETSSKLTSDQTELMPTTERELTTTEFTVTSVTLDLITSESSSEIDKTEFSFPTTEFTKETGFETTEIVDFERDKTSKTPDHTFTTIQTHPEIDITKFFTESTLGLSNVTKKPQDTTEPEVTTRDVFSSKSPEITEPVITTEMGETTTSSGFDCSIMHCLNGGTCYFTPSGSKCRCKQGWGGVRCESHDDIDDAAFTGHSYLTHRLANNSATAVSVAIRTLAPTGLLIYARTAPYIYMAAYLHDGLLKFVFSCGIQTMLFSELHERVNNGYALRITALLEVEGTLGDQHCSASLTVNDSLAMSGSQRIQVAAPVDWRVSQAVLHLGGVPSHQAAPDLPVLLGYTGCMHSLQVDGERRKIFSDALDMFEVSQCSSLACLSSPCHGAATCIEQGDTWTCLCPSGYLGPKCDQSVCLTNPCHFGGTCAPYPGSGFICLCPFGKHGLFCQKDLEIGHPLYTSSVRGLSSFSAYPVPGPSVLHHSFQMRFRFVSQSADQVALLLFVGQDHEHDASADHLAVSYIKGYIVLTWNLGSGPRRIFTPRAVSNKFGSVHVVKFGRAGRQAWLQVDNLDNVTGTSPGGMNELNTQSTVYIGGHKFVNFSGLPHDLPLHSGFAGCIYGVEFRTGRVSVQISQVRAQAIVGRNVGQCGTFHCHNTTCLNGGACLDHGATFTCLCKDGWFGPVCALRYNPCDSSRHNCSFGSTCVPLETGYQCDCPFGRVGQFCEKEEVLTDISFTGHRSFVALPPVDLHLYQTCVELELQVSRDRGLVLFTGHTDSFMSIALHGGILELRLNTVGGPWREGGVLVVRSGRVLSLAMWHSVRAGRYGNRVFLWVDGAVTATTLTQGESLLPFTSPVYLGGVPDLSELPRGAMSGLPVSLTGCMRRVALNWRSVQLTSSYVLAARNVEDCDGTACGGDVCLHGGTCWLDTTLKPHCTCTQAYTGENCELLVSCLELPCENGGLCVKNPNSHPVCQCTKGWEGPFCIQEIPKGVPHFGGDSYLVVDPLNSLTMRGQPNALRRTDIDFLYLNFSTAHPEGMILWSGLEDEYLGVGLENGKVKLVWAWRGSGPTIITLPGPPVTDGGWHDITVSLAEGSVTVWQDRGDPHSYGSHDHTAILTDGVIQLGGFPNFKSTLKKTKGIFREPFQGCVCEVAWNEHSSVTDFSKYQGQNIRSCPMF